MLQQLFDLFPTDLVGWLAMFWHAVLFEVPRVMIASILVGFLEFKQHRQPKLAQPTHILGPRQRISVLLAGHNEGHCLETAIMGLQEQLHDDFEIIVVDDGSSDDMRDVGRKLMAAGYINKFLSTGIRGGKSAAANLGLTYCTGDIVVIADIDTSFDRDALQQLIAPFEDPAVGAVSGNLATRNTNESLVSRWQAIQYLLSISLGRRFTSMLGTLAIASGAFAAFRLETLQAIGGWEVGPGEDADLAIKIRQAGWKISFTPNAWALTDVPVDAMSLYRQRLRWNRSLIRIRLRKFRSVFNPRLPNFSLLNALAHLDIFVFQALLPISFYFYLIGLFAFYGSGAIFIVFAVSMIYILASLINFVVAASMSGHYGRLSLIWYVPGYALFNAFCLRAVSAYSYLDEFFLRKSYKDTYVPERVLDAAEHF